jgi:hypothetical protein
MSIKLSSTRRVWRYQSGNQKPYIKGHHIFFHSNLFRNLIINWNQTWYKCPLHHPLQETSLNSGYQKLYIKGHHINTVKPAHVVTSFRAVTCIKMSSVIENFIWIEPLLRDHLSCKATFSLFQRWPLTTGLTIYGIPRSLHVNDK